MSLIMEKAAVNLAIFLLRIFLSRILVLRSILSVHDHLLTEIVSARSGFAGVDKRIKAVATASMYDISRADHYGWKDSMTKVEYDRMLERLSEQRWKDFEAGEPEYNPSFPVETATEIPAGLDSIGAEFWEYYALKRGHHPRARGGFSETSHLSFINFPLMNYIQTISPRPLLFIIGENAHSRYFSEDAYERAVEPKELYIVPGARHIDLYDRADMIPFDKLETFFKENLK